MMLVSLLSYLDRNTLALLSPTILKETHLSGEDYGWVISSFSAAYMLGNPVWGRLLDRIGLRWGMLAAVALWSAASASHALCATFLGFAAARAALGFGEGATFPGGLRAVTQTLPPESRSRGVALAYSGGSLGAILTPLIVTPVALRWGWRAAFLLTGLAGALWLVIWLSLGRTPALARPHPTSHGEHPRLTDRRLWGLVAAYALGALPLGFVLYASPIYLEKALHLTQKQLGHWLWLPPLGWEVGYFFWGFAIDRGVPIRRTIFALALLSLPLALVPQLDRLDAVLALLFFAMFVASGFVIAALAFATRLYSTAHSAFLAGLAAGGWSAVVAALMPLFGRLFDRQAYSPAFVLAACTPIAGALLFWLLGYTRAP
jgi:ACS family hexuronate transporter-like MFS transporter